MILYNNLSFFNKNGDNLNFKKNYNVEVNIIDNYGRDAIIEIINDLNNNIKFNIINSGYNYSNNLIIEIFDKIKNIKYQIKNEYIHLNQNGGIEKIDIYNELIEQNFTFPSYFYEGNIFIPEISIDLIETENILIGEKYLLNNNNFVYNIPNSEYNFIAKFINQDKFFLFDIERNENEYEIKKSYNKIINLNNNQYNIDNNKLYHLINLNENIFYQLNIGFSSNEENIYEDDLIIGIEKDNNFYEIVKIHFYGETIGEDERFKILLSNFGLNIDNNTYKAFRDVDINESKIDYNILNYKRKELLLEYSNIFPYIGSYKALINALKYFDYNDLIIKSSFSKIIDDKKIYNYVNIFDPNRRNKENELINNNWKRDNFLQIVYKFINVTNEYDEDNLPITKRNFYFSEEEILIKLFYLKEYINKNILPFNIEIKDIVGEGEYFSSLRLNTWKNILRYELINLEKDFDYEIISPSNFYLTNIKLLKNKNKNNLENNTLLSDILNEELNNFINNNNYFSYLHDEMGCPIKLKYKEINLDWSDITINWDSFIEDKFIVNYIITNIYSNNQNIQIKDKNGNIIKEKLYNIVNFNKSNIIDWNNLLNNLNNILEYLDNIELINENNIYKIIITPKSDIYLDLNNFEYNIFVNSLSSIYTFDKLSFEDFYESTWEIQKLTDELDSRQFIKKYRNKIDKNKEYNIILPYTGKYEIKLILHSLNNYNIEKKKIIEIKSPNIDIFGITCYNNYINSWQEFNDKKWKDINSTWLETVIDNNTTWNDLENITWDNLDLNYYLSNKYNYSINKGNIELNINPISISENNKLIGKVINIDENNYITIELYNKLVAPKLTTGDIIYFKEDNIIHKYFIDDIINYTSNKIIISIIPNNNNYNEFYQLLKKNIKNKNFYCYYDIKNHISINYNNDIYKKLKNSKYIYFFRNKNIKEEKRIKLTEKIFDYENNLIGIKISNKIDRIPGEFCKIYKIRKEINGFLINNINTKSIKLLYSLNENEIIPGYTILKINSNNYEQRFLVIKIENNSNLETILYLEEIDGDFNLITNNNILEYEYYSFVSKLTKNQYYSDKRYLLFDFNYYPYNIEFKNETNLNDWYLDYILINHDFSIKINDYLIDNNNTIDIFLNDEYSELQFVGSSYFIDFLEFDNNIDNYIIVNSLNWDKLENTNWDELNHLSYKDIELRKDYLCNFIITNIKNGGKIKFNEEPEFIFTTIYPHLTEEEKWIAAVNELNNHKETSLSFFEYYLNKDNNNNFYISAVAKNKSNTTLGYIKFSNGVKGKYIIDESHTYPTGKWENWNNPYIYGLNNKFANWSTPIRTYYEYGYYLPNERGWYPSRKYDENNNSYIYLPEKIKSTLKEENIFESIELRYSETYRILYDYAITNTYNFNNTLIFDSYYGNKNIFLIKIKDKFNIPQVKIINWIVYKNNEKILDINTKFDYIFLSLFESGKYKIKIKIIDKNNNIYENIFEKIIII